MGHFYEPVYFIHSITYKNAPGNPLGKVRGAPFLLTCHCHCLIVDGLGLILQDKRIIADTSFHQLTTDSGRILMGLVVLQLCGSYTCHRMGHHEPEVSRKPFLRHFYDISAI